MTKTWMVRVTTGLVVAGVVFAAQSVPAGADQQAHSAPAGGAAAVAESVVGDGDGDGYVDVALTEVDSVAGDVGASCGGWRGATAGIGRWAASKSDCAWITQASKKNPQHRRYKWQIQAGSNTRICVQVQGHYWSTSKKKSVATWTTAGCGTSGTALVRWSGPPKKGGGYLGLAATPKVRAKVQPGFLGGQYKWA